MVSHGFHYAVRQVPVRVRVGAGNVREALEHMTVSGLSVRGDETESVFDCALLLQTSNHRTLRSLALTDVTILNTHILGKCKALKVLELRNIKNPEAVKLGSVAECALLEELWITDSNVDCVAFAKGLKLRKVTLTGTKVDDVSVFMHSQHLTYINLERTHVKCVIPLKYCPNLEEVRLQRSRVTDVSVLKGLPKLRNLNFIRWIN
eukprot:Colp12_sorted_trinity150504_noHs@22782